MEIWVVLKSKVESARRTLMEYEELGSYHIENWIPRKDNEMSIKSDSFFETVAQEDGSLLLRPKWISIKDRLPPRDKPFLGYDPSCETEKDRIYVLIYDPPHSYVAESCYCEASGEGYSRWNPTHWMPLPEAPKS